MFIAINICIIIDPAIAVSTTIALSTPVEEMNSLSTSTASHDSNQARQMQTRNAIESPNAGNYNFEI